MGKEEMRESAVQTVRDIAGKTGKGAGKVTGTNTTICGKLGGACKGRITRLEEKKKRILSKLGAELWSLYEGKVFKSVFEQENIKKLVAEIEGYEKEIQKRKEEINAQKRMKEHRIILRQALADLRSKDPRIRRVAIRILDKLKDKSTIPYLKKALNDSEKGVRESASGVLHRLVDTAMKNTLPVEKKVNEAP